MALRYAALALVAGVVTSADIKLLGLTGPDHHEIDINVEEIVSIREPRPIDHVHNGTHCLIFTVDGKFMGVSETCEQVQNILKGLKE